MSTHILPTDLQPILTVTGLRKEFPVRNEGPKRILTAVDQLDLTIYPGETVALVGESGSGKSTVARSIVRLVEPTAGRVVVASTILTDLSSRQLSRAYSEIQMVFQDPNSSLNPIMTVEAILSEPLRLHTSIPRADRRERVLAIMAEVGLDESLLDRYPGQLSGGQRQRVGIARALAVDPKVIILDEPTASLDVSVRGQILALLARMQEQRGIAYLFISHDLQVVEKIAHRTLVMYLGNVVESGPTEDVFNRPVHPYTRALISAAPVAEYGRPKKRFALSGEIPSPIDKPQGCPLAPRCPLVETRCREERPTLQQVGTSDRRAACPPALRRHEPI